MAKAHIVKWGNSLAVRIPKGVAEAARFREGDTLVVEVGKDQVSLRRDDAVPSLQELVAQITPENRYGELSQEVEIGREVVEW